MVYGFIVVCWAVKSTWVLLVRVAVSVSLGLSGLMGLVLVYRAWFWVCGAAVVRWAASVC